MDKTKAFTLKHMGKNCLFDCHHQFLAVDHMFRRNWYAFKKKTIVIDGPLLRLSEHELWDIVCGSAKVTELPLSKPHGYGVYHNWTK